MEILETLVLEQGDGIFEKVTKDLPLSSTYESGVQIFRLEIDPELVILFYKITGDHQVKPQILDNFFPHLKSIVVFAELENYGEWNFPLFVSDRLKNPSANIATVIAVTHSSEAHKQIPDHLLEHGFYLGPSSRLIYFTPGDKESTGQLWKMTFGKLFKSS